MTVICTCAVYSGITMTPCMSRFALLGCGVETLVVNNGHTPVTNVNSPNNYFTTYQCQLVYLASFPGTRPASCRLQYSKAGPGEGLVHFLT